MGDDRNLKLDVHFILVAEAQVLARLLPLVASLALSAPSENDEAQEDQEGSKTPPVQG